MGDPYYTIEGVQKHIQELEAKIDNYTRRLDEFKKSSDSPQGQKMISKCSNCKYFMSVHIESYTEEERFETFLCLKSEWAFHGIARSNFIQEDQEENNEFVPNVSYCNQWAKRIDK